MLAATGVAAGEQEGPGRALAEPGCEERGRPDLVGDDRLDLLGLEDHEVARGWLGVGVGHPDHDAVVGGDSLSVDAVALPQPRVDGEGPRRVDRRAVGRVHDQAPVAELVAEALHDHRGVARQEVGGLELLVLLPAGPHGVGAARG